MNLSWRPPTIETQRLIVRPLDEADAAAVFAYSANPNMTRFTLWDEHRDLNDALTFVRDYARCRYQEQVPEPMGLVLKGRAELGVVGTVGCFWAARPHGTMELGYALGEPHWGQGLVAEAVRALLRVVFRDYSVERVQARCFVDNRPSRRVLEKVGFRDEGTLRASLFRRGRYWDIQMYSLLRGEWAGSAGRDGDAPGARPAVEESGQAGRSQPEA